MAEEFEKNKKVDPIPEHYHGFEEVFDKKEFDTMPPNRPWDHAIELKPGSEPSGCKIYPLNPEEQKELDSFLEEHLKTGRIQSSVSGFEILKLIVNLINFFKMKMHFLM